MTGPQHVIGSLTLTLETRRLESPLGSFTLQRRAYRVLERLMRRPEAVVTTDALIEAVYLDADSEPDTAALQVKQEITKLRGVLHALTGEGEGKLWIRNEHSEGYAIMARTRRVEPT